MFATQITILIALSIAACILLLILIARSGKRQDVVTPDDFRSLKELVERSDAVTKNNIDNFGKTTITGLQNVLSSTNESLRASSDSTRETLDRIAESQTRTLMEMQTRQNASISKLDENLTQKLAESLEKIQSANEKKLSEIQLSVNEKLDKSLNERLDSSFAKVTEQLSELYRSLGELSHMSEGITSLNKTLSGVKTRGTWGEAQLRDIIRETMVPSQYEENCITKPRSNDPVEFAIKIPSKDDSRQFVLLPIDSKFPMDVYMAIVSASEEGDPAAVQRATKQLEIRIKEEARKIRDKYISVPVTTNFAVMYLATESLYAEALRINGLAEFVQNNYGIIIAGPTTITALLNSLRVGFENLTLSKKTEDVRKLLVAIKAQYEKLDELVGAAQKRIDAANKSVSEIGYRTGQINKKMAKISEEMSFSESDAMLGMGDVDMLGIESGVD